MVSRFRPGSRQKCLPDGHASRDPGRNPCNNWPNQRARTLSARLCYTAPPTLSKPNRHKSKATNVTSPGEPFGFQMSWRVGVRAAERCPGLKVMSAHINTLLIRLLLQLCKTRETLKVLDCAAAAQQPRTSFVLRCITEPKPSPTRAHTVVG